MNVLQYPNPTNTGSVSLSMTSVSFKRLFISLNLQVCQQSEMPVTPVDLSVLVSVSKHSKLNQSHKYNFKSFFRMF